MRFPARIVRGRSSPNGISAPFRTLHVEFAEDGTVGGSFRSLHDLVVGLRGSDFRPCVLFYQVNQFIQPLRDAGVEVVDWSRDRDMERDSQIGAGKAERLVRLMPAVARRRSLLKRLRVDLLHLNNSPFVGSHDWLPAALSLGIPCVASMRGDVGRSFSRPHRWLMRRFHRVVPVSSYVASGCAFLRQEQIRVILNGVDLRRLRLQAAEIEPESIRRSLGIPDDAFVAVMVGTVREWKGQDRVVEAVSILPRSIRDRVRLLLVGGWGTSDEPYVARIRRQIASNGLEGQVHLLGAQMNVPPFFRAADVAIHASVLGEPFGLVIVEAMGVGTPVLAASEGGGVEILEGGGGLLHDPQHPRELAALLEALIQQPKRLEVLSKEASAAVQVFSIEHTRERFRDLFLQLLVSA